MVMPFDRNEFSNIRFFKFLRNNSFQIKLKSREQKIVSVKATIDMDTGAQLISLNYQLHLRCLMTPYSIGVVS